MDDNSKKQSFQYLNSGLFVDMFVSIGSAAMAMVRIRSTYGRCGVENWRPWQSVTPAAAKQTIGFHAPRA